LKHDKHLERTPVLALIYAGNHTLMENLERAGVEFVTCVGDTILNPDLLTEIIVGLGPDDRIERKLKVVCRHIHWEMIDSEHEMALCGAYRNRMVLGYGRLHSLCETEDHRQCEYFLDPRIRS
jgi:hypothetical protein